MKVNFNNLRKQAVLSYDRLTQKLNDSIIIRDDQYAEPNDEYHTNLKGYVVVNAKEIQDEMDSLRRMIGTISMISEEGNEDFKDVYDELFPENHQCMKTFNDPE